MRQKYKVGDMVRFTFAGDPNEIGKITQVEKNIKEIKYTIMDRRYTYRILQENIKGKN